MNPCKTFKISKEYCGFKDRSSVISVEQQIHLLGGVQSLNTLMSVSKKRFYFVVSVYKMVTIFL